MKRLITLLFVATVSVYAETQTTVADTVRLAINGQNAVGTVNISWPTFTQPDSTFVAGGSMPITLSHGAFSITLAPTQGATPAGSGTVPVYYTVTYSLTSGATVQEYWSVPITGASLTIAQVLVPVPPELISPSGTSLPGSCNVGDLFLLRNLTNGQLYSCVNPNVWANLVTLNGGVTWTQASGAPSGACTNGSLYSETSAGSLYICQAHAWVQK